ncbi:MAG: type II secretion system protein [Planctomycetota bacterium]|nr:MAG: type II secretion system protein [Planctomycetota bacterium]
MSLSSPRLCERRPRRRAAQRNGRVALGEKGRKTRSAACARGVFRLGEAPRACLVCAQPLRPRQAGFTLIEILISLGIIALLIALTSASLRNALASARAFKCQAKLRDLAFDFIVFGDPSMRTVRGNDKTLPRERFHVATFQEAKYKIDEFWGWGEDNREARVPNTEPALEPLRCPEVEQREFVFRRNASAGQGAIATPQAVSYTFNARLALGARIDRFGRPRITELAPSFDLLDEGAVPLVWDAEGEQARRQRQFAEFSAPPLPQRPGAPPDYIFFNGLRWFPAMRHSNTMHVAFVGGQVKRTSHPLREPGWKWGYTAKP